LKIPIIGASISGLYTAIGLARQGLGCTVFDRRGKNFEKRTLIVTPEVLNFIKIPDEIILNRIFRFELYSKRARTTIELEKPDIVFERSAFEGYLERLATSEGVEILRERELQGVFNDGKEWVIELKSVGSDRKDHLKINRIIGADGVCSKVAGSLGLSHKKVNLVQARVKLPKGHKRDTTRVWFDKRFTDYFIWLIPDSKDTGVCGLCLEGKDAKERLDAFIKELDLEVLEYEAGFAACYLPSFYPEISVDGMKAYLVGDAGLQVKMSTVGGVFAGLWGAYAVSKSLAKGIPFKTLYKDLKRELDVHFYIRKTLSSMDESDYDRLIQKVSVNLKDVLYSMPRDKARSLVFKMLIKEPYVLWLGAKGVLKNLGG